MKTVLLNALQLHYEFPFLETELRCQEVDSVHDDLKNREEDEAAAAIGSELAATVTTALLPTAAVAAGSADEVQLARKGDGDCCDEQQDLEQEEEAGREEGEEEVRHVEEGLGDEGGASARALEKWVEPAEEQEEGGSDVVEGEVDAGEDGE